MFVANAITRNKEKAQLGTIALTPLGTKSRLSRKQPQIAKQITHCYINFKKKLWKP